MTESRLPSPGAADAPQDWRRVLWPTLLVAASIATTFGFACAVPFAALGAAAALTMAPRDALMTIGAIWLVNQAVGFGFLGYPVDADCLTWGAALGLVALLTTLAAQWVGLRLGGRGAILPLAAFAAAFGVYEGTLLSITPVLSAGAEDASLAIVARILAINAAAFGALLVLNRLVSATGIAAVPAIRLRAAARHV